MPTVMKTWFTEDPMQSLILVFFYSTNRNLRIRSELQYFPLSYSADMNDFADISLYMNAFEM